MSDTKPTEQDSAPKILFVDDEENVLRSLRRLFMDENYDIHTALSGEKGLEILKEGEMAVIVSDQRMPNMTGAEFLERARRISPNSVRIVLTGYADMNAAIDAINKGGIYQYVTKPWDDEEFTLTIRRAAERYRLVQENKRLVNIISSQNEELKKWNSELKARVQEQTEELRYKNRALLQLNEQLKSNFKSLTITVSNLIELRDKTVGHHSNNVAVLSRKIAAKLNLSERETETIAIGAQLHDIGKIGVSDAVLWKDVESLEPYELREYQTHSVRGQAVMDSHVVLREAGILVRHHHEAFDGQGFPDGLKGGDIPLGSRIIAVADKYDRLLATKSGKEALEATVALAGSQFDSQLCRLLVEIVKEGARSERSEGPAIEIEIGHDRLIPGMTLSRDLRSGTGILLLPQGARLNPQKIESIKRYYRLDPPRTGVYVWTDSC